MMSEPHEEHWLTYVELGRLLGCTANAARVRAQRHGWPRRAPNIVGGRAAVLVPEEVIVRGSATHIEPVCDERPADDVRGPNGTVHPHVQALVQAIDSLTAQLATKDAQIERADERARHECARADRLETVLADAVAAERIAANEAAALRTKDDERRQWGLWRRLRWALRGFRRG
jgi:hypothetical protein